MIEIKSSEYYSAKIRTEEEIADIIKKLKKEGKKAGLCIGGYDLLHPGHMKHLNSAKQFCDVLVVGVTADKFNSKRKKGWGRPIYNENLRAYSLSQLSSVDYVFVSNYRMAVEPIMMIKPNFYIKGPDYKDKKTPGITIEREAISAIGGQIIYTTDETLSTTNIIRYIKDELKIGILLIVDRDGTIIEDKGFLGKNENWKEEVIFLKPVLNLINFIQEMSECKTAIISNQAGVARGYFSIEKVEEINNYLHNELSKIGVNVDWWNYCPYVDKDYVEYKKELNFNPEFIKNKTKRKPGIDMVIDVLKKNNLNVSSFDKIIVLGDTKDDELLAQNLGAAYIDVKTKDYNSLKNEFLSKL